MIRKIGRKKFNIFALDIETHNDDESIAKRETSCWLGCFIDENSKQDDENSYFYSIDEFIDKIEKLSTRKRNSRKDTTIIKNYLIYVWNLSFEYSFILPKLLERGYIFDEELKADKCFNSVTTRSVSSVWECKLKTAKNSGIVIFRDLAKIFCGTLKKTAESFGLKTQKGEIDYKLNRLHNHVVTEEEKEYCFKDTKIVMEILEEMNKKDDKLFFKSISMASYSMLKMIKTAYPNKLTPYKEFRKDYPLLDKKESDFLRKSVSGGICYACENYQFKVINNTIAHIDARSMHPSSAYLHRYPYGKGTYHKGKPRDITKMSCCRVLVSYSGVKIHSIIKLINIPFCEDFELTLWDFEIETMKKCYINLTIKYLDYYEYNLKCLKWRKYYKQCFYLKARAKETGDKFNYLFNKLLMNSSYGKLLEKPHLQTFENIIDEEGIITSVIHDRNKKESETQEHFDNSLINAKYTYLPVGSAIPAFSRVCLIELALKIGWEYITYFDTDSIFFIWNETTKANYEKYCNLKNELGGWSMEEFIDRSQYTAPKRYKTETDRKATFKIGGFNLENYKEEHDIKDNDDILFDDIDIESSRFKVKRAFRCKGGTIIDFQEKEIKVQEKYIDIYNKNK